jgi:cytochrome P450
LHAEPALARYAFEEAVRYDTPSPIQFRTTSRGCELGGQALPADQKLLLVFAAANRDPRRWPDPERFDIERRPTGHLGFGSGIHACVGQLIARLEGEELLSALACRVVRLEVAGTPERWLNNAVRSFATLPLKLVAA